MPNERMHKRTIFIIASLFIVLLAGSRICWILTFQNGHQPHALNGQLDLRSWDAGDNRTVALDGQWEFYPGVGLMSDRIDRILDHPLYIQVPGNWNAALQPEHRTPYGYGSYRLSVLVNPANDYTYSIRIPSVRSSSALYVNGRLLVKSGQPADNEKEYVARNVPYSASFSSNGRSVIEIVIEAANFKDARESGIVRSIKFGTEEAVDRETQLSMSMQQMSAVVFLMHGGYALIIYLAGTRDRRLLYFSLLAGSAMLWFLLGSEEKILSYWLPIDYEWGFKLVHMAMTGFALSLFQCVRQQISANWRKALSRIVAVCGVAALLALMLPARYILTLQPLFLSLTLASILVAFLTMLRTSMKDIKENVLLLLSLIAFSSHLVWWGIFLITGIKTVYYPFDLLVSTICFASVWFRRYFQVHAETRKLAEKLQKTDKLKDEFLSNTSHELRNPLHGILNISQAVLEREQHSMSDKSVKDLETVLSVGRRMSLMLNDLLDAMSLKENVPRLQLRSFSIHAVARGVMDLLHLMTQGKPVRLTNHIPEPFPQVFADENRVVQIVFNLLHNAVKFTNEGEIAIRGHAEDGMAHIAVTDTGIGMDEETMRRIFEPYEQDPNGKTMFEGGFGLGLSISKQLVELHGGTLTVRSVPGQGSEFVFTLPLADQAANLIPAAPGVLASTACTAETETIAASSLLGSTSARQTRPIADRSRILIVDDDPVNLNVLENILTTERYEIVAVTSGKSALEILDTKEWDLVVSDVMMPQMSGYELTRTIRKRFTVTELPVLLLTARSQPEDIENGFLSGANDYVTKPVDALELRSRVQALTEVRRSARERLRMEAAWLQAQIQPHFLFNTLNAVAALSEVDTERMRALLEAFGNFLRNKFQFQNIDALVPIEDELSLVRSYLYIEKERFEGRLRVAWETDECEHLSIPPLTIQPLVENAVRHGIMKRKNGGTVTIRVTDFGLYAEITVADDGYGMDKDTVQRLLVRQFGKPSGIGLLNTDLRLRRHYGRGLQINSVPGNGTSISFIVFKQNESSVHSEPSMYGT